MENYNYLSPEWATEAHRRLSNELSPESMKFVSSSMITLYENCPDGKDRALYYRFEKGVINELSVSEDEIPDAEFTISGDYDTFARISRAELGSRRALMTGKLRLRGNMVKALSLSVIVDRMNKVLATIPAVY